MQPIFILRRHLEGAFEVFSQSQSSKDFLEGGFEVKYSARDNKLCHSPCFAIRARERFWSPRYEVCSLAAQDKENSNLKQGQSRLDFLPMVCSHGESMGRGKPSLRLIEKKADRQVTFKKRKFGLLKKVKELTILCDVEACMIISSPQSEGGVDVWPDMDNAMKVIERYRDLPQEEQGKQKMDNFSLVQQQNEKLENKLKEICMQNKHLEMENDYPSWDPHLDNYTIQQLQELTSLINSKMEEAFNSIQSHKNNIQSMDADNQPVPEAVQTNNEFIPQEQNILSLCPHQDPCPDVQACIDRLFQQQQQHASTDEPPLPAADNNIVSIDPADANVSFAPVDSSIAPADTNVSIAPDKTGVDNHMDSAPVDNASADNNVSIAPVDNHMDSAPVDNASNPDFLNFDPFGIPRSPLFSFTSYESQVFCPKYDFDDSPWNDTIFD
eukprot:Gb_05359 [translate_table: standard]